MKKVQEVKMIKPGRKSELHPNTKDLRKKRFGALVVTGIAPSVKYRNPNTGKQISRAAWECTCTACGNKVVVEGYKLVQGKKRSCGCLTNFHRAKRKRMTSMEKISFDARQQRLKAARTRVNVVHDIFVIQEVKSLKYAVIAVSGDLFFKHKKVTGMTAEFDTFEKAIQELRINGLDERNYNIVKVPQR